MPPGHIDGRCGHQGVPVETVVLLVKPKVIIAQAETSQHCQEAQASVKRHDKWKSLSVIGSLYLLT